MYIVHYIILSDGLGKCKTELTSGMNNQEQIDMYWRRNFVSKINVYLMINYFMLNLETTVKVLQWKNESATMGQKYKQFWENSYFRAL